MGVLSLAKTRRATGSATAMISRDSPMDSLPNVRIHSRVPGTAETQVLNLLFFKKYILGGPIEQSAAQHSSLLLALARPGGGSCGLQGIA